MDRGRVSAARRPSCIGCPVLMPAISLMMSDQQSERSGAMVRLLICVTIVLAPLILIALVRPPTHHSFTYTVGKNLALVGFTILALQFVLSARLKWIERPFGLEDVLFQLHKVMAISG